MHITMLFKNISDSNICELTAHPKAQQIVQQVTHKHFSDGRSDFHGSTVSGHNELMTCSMGTVFYALKKTRRDNITTGFPNTWLVKTPQQIEANFALWVHSRLLEDVGRGHNCGARTNSSTHTNGRMRIFSSLSYTNDSGDSNEHDVHVDSNPETILIERMELQQQTEMIELIHHFPLIAMSTVFERIENQTEMSWALIPKSMPTICANG